MPKPGCCALQPARELADHEVVFSRASPGGSITLRATWNTVWPLAV
ncbi:MAG: hypothetical protein U0527_06635 [Candidatus Eisenbacteria bacterium]